MSDYNYSPCVSQCPCVPSDETQCPTPPIGGSVTMTQVPLSNGLNIPLFGVCSAPLQFYTICDYWPEGFRPGVQEYLSVHVEDTGFVWYDKTLVVQVVSYPMPTLKAPSGWRVEQVSEFGQKFYPNDSDEFYVEVVQETSPVVGEGTYQTKYLLTLHGYNTEYSSAFAAEFSVVAGSNSDSFTLELPTPFTKVSPSRLFLNQTGSEYGLVDVKSNQMWRVRL